LLRSAKASWPADIDAATRWYEPHLRRIYDDAHVRQADLIQLSRIASTYASRERFLTEVTLDPPAATSDEAGAPGLDDDYLILSTIHSAKGEEWRSVHILNVVDGCIPSDLSTGSAEEIEEERRLLYVAMTRARDELRLMVPQRFYVHQQTQYGDRHVYASRTRFIPDHLVKLFDRCSRFLDTFAQAQILERSPCVGHRAPQNLLDFTDTLRVQALLSLHGTKIHERITEKLLLFPRHSPSIQCLERTPPRVLITFVASRQ